MTLSELLLGVDAKRRPHPRPVATEAELPRNDPNDVAGRIVESNCRTNGVPGFPGPVLADQGDTPPAALRLVLGEHAALNQLHAEHLEEARR